MDYIENFESNVNGKYLIYKNKPLVRQGNQICYGSIDDEYMMYLMILSNKTVKIGEATKEVPGKVIVQIIKSNPKLSPLERMVKQFDLNGLYEAFSAGLVYLERMENQNKKA